MLRSMVSVMALLVGLGFFMTQMTAVSAGTHKEKSHKAKKYKKKMKKKKKQMVKQQATEEDAAEDFGDAEDSTEADYDDSEENE